MKRKIIIDTDPGIDDAYAIISAFKHPDVEILGLTTVAGNKGIDFTTRNAAGLSTYLGSQMPVYRGAVNDYVSLKNGVTEIKVEEGGGVHGATGLGSVELPVDESVYREESAVDFILESVKKYPGEVDIIAIGPVTNLALCLDKDLDTMKQVRSIHSMGGGVARGNASPVAEFNYWFDPTAVDRLFTELGPHVPIYMIGLDVTHQAVVDINDLTFIKLVGGELGELLFDIMQDYVSAYWKNNHYLGGVIHDLMTVVGYLYPEIYTKTYHAHLRCVTDSEVAFGQTVVDLKGKYPGEKNAYVPMEVDVQLYKERFMEMLFDKETAKLYRETVLHK